MWTNDANRMKGNEWVSRLQGVGWHCFSYGVYVTTILKPPNVLFKGFGGQQQGSPGFSRTGVCEKSLIQALGI